MTRASLTLACAVLTAAVPVAQDLPAGAGRDLLMKRCVSCHETDLITGQRLTRTGWERSIDKMVRWGAVVDAAERAPMLDYLAAHWAPRLQPSHAAEAMAAGEAVYKRACLTCHESDLIEEQRLGRPGWVREVDKMIRWGAVVPDAEKDALVNYLAARFPPR